MTDILDFEQLSVDSASKLVGGFSPVLSDNDSIKTEKTNHNCHGGNCKAGCGNGYKSKKKKKGTASNNCGSGHNCATSCK